MSISFSDTTEISVKDEKIRENLAPLRENLKKKMRAQEAYYNSNKVNRSPLLFDRRPVRDRLGKVKFLGTDTSGILPRPRNILRGGNFKNYRKQGRYSAQMRLNRLRARLNASAQNKNKPFRLRRNLNFLDDSLPTNLTVQVDNTQYGKHNSFKLENGSRDMRFRPVLNEKTQQQIAIIQKKRYYQDILPMRFTPVATGIFLHERFTSYMF